MQIRVQSLDPMVEGRWPFMSASARNSMHRTSLVGLTRAMTTAGSVSDPIRAPLA